MASAKSLFISKTFWFNILSLAITIGELLPDRIALGVVAVGNLGLRIISGQPVKLWGGE